MKKNYFLFPQPEYLNDIMHHVNRPLFATPELKLEERKKAFKYANSIVRKHVRARKLKFEKWLTKEKLRDYYGIKGLLAEVIARLYCLKWTAKLIRLFAP